MLVVTHEGTYLLERDSRGRTVERPCSLALAGPCVEDDTEAVASATHRRPS